MSHVIAEDTRVHALLIDDDVRLLDRLREFLEYYGCRVSVRDSGKDIEHVVEEVNPDIVLLDVMMPGDDGFTVLLRLRAVSSIPVIMLTARGDDTDRIVGLEMGADYYLPKPYNPRELLASIKAVLRRTNARDSDHAAAPHREPEVLQAGPMRLDLKRQRLHYHDKHIDLATTEFRLIQAFMSRPGEILTRDDLQTLAFGENYFCNDRNIDVYVSRIRNTLRGLCGESFIRTVWGTGYSWIQEA